jgi:hypothetical protein
MEEGMSAKFDIVSENRSVAIAFVSPYRKDSDFIVASVMPIHRSGKWENSTLEFSFLKVSTELFPNNTPEIDVVKGLLTRAGIDPQKCVVAQVPFAGSEDGHGGKRYV